jgi:hypothetical protein
VTKRQYIDEFQYHCVPLDHCEPLSRAPMTSRASVSHVNLLIRGGYVLAMDAAGDIPGGDVSIRGGIIHAADNNLDVPEAEVVEVFVKIIGPVSSVPAGTGGKSWNARIPMGARQPGAPV